MMFVFVFMGTWLAFGVLHYALVVKDWRGEQQLRPHAWIYAIALFVPLVLFGPIGLIIRDWMHREFPEWFSDNRQ